MGKKLLSGLTSLAFIGYFVYQMFFAFGSKVDFGGGQEVYYTSGATEAQAQSVGDTLKAIEFFNDNGEAAVQVVKRDEGYAVRFVTIDEAWTDPGYKKIFARMGWTISQNALDGANVTIELCDTSFETKASFEMEESRLDETKVVDITATENVYFNGEATEEDAKKLGAALQGLGFFDGQGRGSAQVDKKDGKFIVRLVTVESAWADTSLHKEFETAAWNLSQDVYGGEPLTLELCDSMLDPKVALEMKKP